MSEVRALIEALVERGVDPIDAAEIITRAALHGAASAPKARSAAAIRQERHRRNKALQVTVSDASAKEGFPAPFQEKTNPPIPPKGGLSPQWFESFWSLYPHKIGKRDAEKAFSRAIRRASFDAIMAGLRQYAAKTDDRPWCNPATWLNQDRWGDRPAAGAHSPPRLVEDDAQWARRLRYARTNSRWSTAEWGPLPGAAGSRVPGHLVEAGDGNGWQELENAA